MSTFPDQELFHFGAEAIIQGPSESSAFAIGPLPMNVGGEGDLIIQFKQHGEDWEEIERLPVQRVLTSPSTSKRQPS